MTKFTIDRVRMIGQPSFYAVVMNQVAQVSHLIFNHFRECTGLHDIISLGLPSEAM